MNYKVLYAEDEPTLAQIIGEGLRSSGYEVVVAADGLRALEAFKSNPPDICVLDIMMPLKNGYTLAADIRRLENDIPIIFLSAKSLPEDVIRGFKSGGNDYLRKPFNMGELLARMEALLTRFGAKKETNAPASNLQKFGKCELDTVTQQLKTPLDNYALSFKETALLRLLIEHRNTLLERQVPLQKIWYEDTYYNARSMDVFMSHLRKMLKDDPSIQLMTIRGAGYKLIF